MKINFTFKNNTRITKEDKEYARKKLEKIGDIEETLGIYMIYEYQNGLPKEKMHRVSIETHFQNGEFLKVEDEAITFRAAIDLAQEKALNMARKIKERITNKKAKRKTKPTEIMK